MHLDTIIGHQWKMHDVILINQLNFTYVIEPELMVQSRSHSHDMSALQEEMSVMKVVMKCDTMMGLNQLNFTYEINIFDITKRMVIAPILSLVTVDIAPKLGAIPLGMSVRTMRAPLGAVGHGSDTQFRFQESFQTGIFPM